MFIFEKNKNKKLKSSVRKTWAIAWSAVRSDDSFAIADGAHIVAYTALRDSADSKCGGIKVYNASLVYRRCIRKAQAAFQARQLNEVARWYP